MTKYELQLYIHMVTFYGFHMLLKFVQSHCLRSNIIGDETKAIVLNTSIIVNKMYNKWV